MSQNNLQHPNVQTSTLATTLPTGNGASGTYSIPLNTGAQTVATGYGTYTTFNNAYGYGTDINVPGKIAAKDVVLDGVSMKELMQTIQDRLAILVPDQEKLEKFASLKECYDQYKLLERLCTIDKTDDNK